MCELHIDAGRAPGARLMREDRTHSQSYTVRGDRHYTLGLS